MKFAKRVARLAAQNRWKEYPLDYSRLKHSIATAKGTAHASTQEFDVLIASELERIGSHLSDEERRLEAELKLFQAADTSIDAGQNLEALKSFRTQVGDLLNFALLNYIGVLKAVKKRNRHLPAAPRLDATDLLRHQTFFTSGKLAMLATTSEVLELALNPDPVAAAALSECPICLDLLESPVVLTCAHRFCQGCLLSHCLAHLARQAGDGRPLPGASSDGGKAAELDRLDALASDKAAPPAVDVGSLVSEDGRDGTADMYNCPVCRKAQVMDLIHLQTDAALLDFLDKLKRTADHPGPPSDEEEATGGASGPLHAHSTAGAAPPCRRAAQSHISASTPCTQSHAPAGSSHSSMSSRTVPGRHDVAPTLIPPQLSPHRLTVALDLDGTLISSFNPRRTPALRDGLNRYVVAQGSELNPGGVLVVERPGLAAFLGALASFAEVLVFTAGLASYAAPIIDALDPSGHLIAARVYRDGCSPTPHYPCVKDLALLGRRLESTVLVDDTPLAFLHQPDNGVPVFGFRGDPDDALLLEAVLPLLQACAQVEDVRPLLRSRFAMPAWFASSGSPDYSCVPPPVVLPPQLTAAAAPVSGPANGPQGPPPGPPRPAPRVQWAVACGLEGVLISGDVGEAAVAALAPELAPMLAAEATLPATCPLPVLNAVLGQLAARGVSRESLLKTLRGLGRRQDLLSPAGLRCLAGLAAAGVSAHLLADCNALFATQLLRGALERGVQLPVLGYPASFEATAEGGHCLVVQPAAASGSGCGVCPCSKCKGRQMQGLETEVGAARWVYVGAGVADLCAVAALREGDVACVARGSRLEGLLTEHAGMVRASVVHWGDLEELGELLLSITGEERAVSSGDGSAGTEQHRGGPPSVCMDIEGA